MDIVYSGWLRKQGGGFRTVRTRWFEIKGDQLYYYKDNKVYSGWLRKQGGGFRTVRTRWFEIKGDQLYYYKDNKEPKTPLGIVPLAGNEVVRYSPDPNDPGKYKFEIVSGKDKAGRNVTEGHETFVLIASTMQEMDTWISVINRIIYQPFGGGMFGGELAETIKYEARKGGGFVPIIVDICIKYIKENGLDEEGLFRLPGNMKMISELKAAFNRGENPDISDRDIHTVASLLKLYLRELSEPLIPYDFFEVFLTAAKCYEMYEDDGITSIQKHLQQLPKANYNLLKVLCRFLFEVQEHSDKSKMDTRNVAMVFGPNILRSGSEDPQVMMECTGQVTALICILIRRHQLFFPPSDDECTYSPPPPKPDRGSKLLIDFNAESPVMPRASAPGASPSGNFSLADQDIFQEAIVRNGPAEEVDLKTQLEEMENEMELQQQQIKELQMDLEKQRKVQEMLLIRLSDEQRARVSAEDRLAKLKDKMDEFIVQNGGFGFGQSHQ